MNIFFLDPRPSVAPQYMVDRHVNKMIIESAQMLANCYLLKELREAPLTQKHEARKHSHIFHPCSRWTMQSSAHFDWLLQHAFALCEERYFRFGKFHYTKAFLNWCCNNRPYIFHNDWTDPPCAMPGEYIIEDDALESYRNYYVNGKSHLHQWTNRNKPWWFNIYEECHERSIERSLP